jgi:hypothetical protein
MAAKEEQLVAAERFVVKSNHASYRNNRSTCTFQRLLSEG